MLKRMHLQPLSLFQLFTTYNYRRKQTSKNQDLSEFHTLHIIFKCIQKIKYSKALSTL